MVFEMCSINKIESNLKKLNVITLKLYCIYIQIFSIIFDVANIMYFKSSIELINGVQLFL